MGLIKVHSPDSEPELVAVVAMLEAHEIPCFVENAGFGSLYPGPQIGAFNARAIMVPEEKARDALKLIGDFEAEPSTTPVTNPSPFSKLRMIVEALVVGWFVPGGRRRK